MPTSTVIGFPHGGRSAEVKVTTSLNALREGATELDMVINIGALIEKDYATVEDVRLLRQIVGEAVGVKASGGIRSLDDALAMIEAGATRLGTSSTAQILGELRGRRGER